MSSKASFIAAGDVFMTRRMPEKGYQGFGELVDLIQQHDVRFANLELTIHNREGYPFAYSGGTWAMAAPEVLDDINRYHFNVFNAANNHSMDYSHNGLLATMGYLEKRNMIYAGIGRNLADAAAPVYLECPEARVALVAATATFHESWRAGNQRMDMQGRPGVNPLRAKTEYHVEKKYYDQLAAMADLIHINANRNLNIKEGFEKAPADHKTFVFGSEEFVEDTVNEKRTYPLETDMQRIIASIAEAKKQSDYVLVSIHAHQFAEEDKELPAEFLQIFARCCIDAGASVIIGHGPHILRGIELYHGGVIFYSLGNFLFENDTVTHLPADFYENRNMDLNAMVGAGMDDRSKNDTIGLGVNPKVWESVIAGWEMENGKIKEVSLYPIQLGFQMARYRKGLPFFCKDTHILEHLTNLSAPFGTKIIDQEWRG